MKKIKLISLATLTLLAFACTKEQEQKEEVKDSITLKTADMTVGKSGVAESSASAAAIEFTATNDWTATPSVDWITVSPTNGKAGDVKLDVTVGVNETYENRSGKVEISCGEAKAAVFINQTLNEVFGVAINKTIGYEEQVLELTVVSNQGHTVMIDFGGGEPWIEETTSKAEPSEEVLTFAVQENSGKTNRTADIFIGSENEQGAVRYIITQEGRANSELSQAAYAGNKQKPYDTYNYVLTDFGQFIVELDKTDGSNTSAILVLNVAPKAGIDKTVLPTGVFVCDATGEHANGTFSIKPADDSEPGYTCFMDAEGNMSEVLDGTITVGKKDTFYNIKAELMDENGEIQVYKWDGEAPAIEDQAFGTKIALEFKSDYETYYTTKANEWNTNIYVSEKLNEEDQFYVYNLALQLWGSAGEKSAADFEEGTYTWAPVDEEGDVSGKMNAEPMTFWGGEYGYALDAEGETVYVAITGGTIKFSNKTNIDLVAEYDLDLKFWKWSDDWSEQISLGTMKYTATDEAAIYTVSDTGMRPHPDEDHEFKTMDIASGYVGFWYGKGVFTTNSQYFWFGWNSTFDGAWKVELGVNASADWVYEKNYGGRFCNTPLPNGTYNFSYSKVDDCLCNIKTASRATRVYNTYSGSNFWVRGGSLTVTDESITLDLYAAPKNEDGTYGNQLHFTGTIANSCMYWQDYSARTAPAWNDDEDPEKPLPTEKIDLTAGMISSNDPMQYVCGGDGTGDYGLAFNPDWFNYITSDQTEARSAKFGKAENMWDDDLSTSYHLNLDWGDPYTSWSVRGWDINSDRYAKRYIQITFNEPYRAVDLKWVNSDQGRLAESYEISTSTDGSAFTDVKTGITTGNWNDTVEVKDIKGDAIKAVRITNSKGDADWTYIVAAFGIAELEVKAAK